MPTHLYRMTVTVAIDAEDDTEALKYALETKDHLARNASVRCVSDPDHFGTEASQTPSLPRKKRDEVVRILLYLFTWEEFTRFLSYGSTRNIVVLLPSSGPLIFLVGEAVERLARERLFDEDFFQRLIEERPRRLDDIQRIRDLVGG